MRTVNKPGDKNYTSSDCWGWHTYQCSDCNNPSGCNQTEDKAGQTNCFQPAIMCPACGRYHAEEVKCSCRELALAPVCFVCNVVMDYQGSEEPWHNTRDFFACPVCGVERVQRHFINE